MAKQETLDRMYIKMAYDASEISHAVRRKVGAVLVVPEGGRFEGVNGTPSGFDNCCEDYVYEAEDGCRYDPSIVDNCTPVSKDVWTMPRGTILRRVPVTKPECLHAESNAIMKVTRSTQSSVGSTIYTTLTPCFDCARLIIQAGVVRVVYSEEYPYPGHNGPVRAMGLDLLRQAGIQVDRLDLSSHHVEDDLDMQDEGFGFEEEPQQRGHFE